jgi:hypothetical protein
MSGNEESITEESIKAEKADYVTLISNRDELTKLTKELSLKKDQIYRINQRVEKNLHNPIKPSVLDLNERNNRGWDSYFEEANRRIQEKKEQDTLREQLEGLEKERKEIEAKIIPLVPPSLHNKQIIVLNNSRITVNGENVITM